MSTAGLLTMAGLGLPGETHDKLLEIELPELLAPGIHTAPRILAPQTAATRAINDTLSRLNLEFRDLIRHFPSLSAMDDAFRTIKAAAVGDEFLIVDVREGYYFPGALRPSYGATSYVHDITTDELANWTSLLWPIAQKAYPFTKDGERGSIAIRSHKLHRYYLGERHKDPHWEHCVGVFEDPETAFMVSLDTSGRGIYIEPFDPPRVVLACAESVLVPTAELRRLGVSSKLIDVLEKTEQVTA